MASTYLVSLADLDELVLCSRVFVLVRMPETQMTACENVLRQPFFFQPRSLGPPSLWPNDSHFITLYTAVTIRSEAVV